jgi:hypothetical protein
LAGAESVAVAREFRDPGGTDEPASNDEAIWRLREGKRGEPGADGVIFPGKTADHLNNVRRSWLAVLETACINRIRWHDLRRTFASRLIMAGVDLNTVCEPLGQSDYKMTLRYAHLAPEHKAAVAKLGRLLAPWCQGSGPRNRSPDRSEWRALVELVAAPVWRFDLVADRVSQRQLIIARSGGFAASYGALIAHLRQRVGSAGGP